MLRYINAHQDCFGQSDAMSVSLNLTSLPKNYCPNLSFPKILVGHTAAFHQHHRYLSGCTVVKLPARFLFVPTSAPVLALAVLWLLLLLLLLGSPLIVGFLAVLILLLLLLMLLLSSLIVSSILISTFLA